MRNTQKLFSLLLIFGSHAIAANAVEPPAPHCATTLAKAQTLSAGAPWARDVTMRSMTLRKAASGNETTRWSDLYRSQVVEFEVDDASAFVVKPRKVRGDGKRPWVWYAPSLRNEDGRWTLPTRRHANVVSTLLDQGFHFCGVHVGESCGSPAGREIFTKFHMHVVSHFGLANKACLFPVSRGGLMHYNWAAEHPDLVRCIGAIYPVCDLTHWPGLEKASGLFGIPADRLAAERDKHNPLDRLAPLAAARVPILHLHGDSDDVVPLERHSAELARRYKKLGGSIELVVVAGKGHEFAAEYWENTRLAEFFLQHVD